MIKQSKLLKIKNKFLSNFFNEKYELKMGEFNNTTETEWINLVFLEILLEIQILCNLTNAPLAFANVFLRLFMPPPCLRTLTPSYVNCLTPSSSCPLFVIFAWSSAFILICFHLSALVNFTETCYHYIEPHLGTPLKFSGDQHLLQVVESLPLGFLQWIFRVTLLRLSYTDFGVLLIL